MLTVTGDDIHDDRCVSIPIDVLVYNYPRDPVYHLCRIEKRRQKYRSGRTIFHWTRDILFHIYLEPDGYNGSDSGSYSNRHHLACSR